MIMTGLLFWLAGYCQKDTAAMVKELTELLSFTEKPYLAYEMDIQFKSQPVMESVDTMKQRAVFFKRENDIYFNNGRDEMLVLDSILFRINSERQTIWISKLSKAQRDEFRHVVPGQREMTTMFRKSYVLENVAAGKEGYKKIKLHSKNNNMEGNSGSVTVLYDTKKKWPETMEIEMQVKEPASEEMLELLKAEGVDVVRLLKQENGNSYIMRKQSMALTFMNIRFKKEDVAGIPRWEDIVEADPEQGGLQGKAKYKDYEVTKLY